MNKKTIEKFLNLLEGEQGCNFHLKDEKKPESVVWTCDNTEERPLANKILRGMKISESEIGEIMDICDHNGGYCDCEILFNAEEALLENYN